MKGNREMTGSENSDLRTVLFVYHSAAQTRPHLLSEPSTLVLPEFCSSDFNTLRCSGNRKRHRCFFGPSPASYLK